MGSLGSFVDLILPAHYCPRVNSASNRKKFHRYLPGEGLKAASANLATFMCLLSRNSGSFNLLEPHGPVQASIGTSYMNCCRLKLIYGYFHSIHK